MNSDAIIIDNVDVTNQINDAAAQGVQLSDQLSQAGTEFADGVKSVLTPKGVGGAVATTAVTVGAIGIGYAAVKYGAKMGRFFARKFTEAKDKVLNDNKNEKCVKKASEAYEEAKDLASKKKEQVKETVDQAKATVQETVQETVEQVKETVNEVVDSIPEVTKLAAKTSEVSDAKLVVEKEGK